MFKLRSSVDGLHLRLANIPKLSHTSPKMDNRIPHAKVNVTLVLPWSLINVYSMNIQTSFFLVPELLNYTYKPGLSQAKFCVIWWGLLLLLSKIVRSFHLDYTELRILRISSGCQLVYQESWKQGFVGCKAKIRYRAHHYDGTRIMFRLFVLSIQRIPKQGSHCCFPFPIYHKGWFQGFHFPSHADSLPLSVGLLLIKLEATGSFYGYTVFLFVKVIRSFPFTLHIPYVQNPGQNHPTWAKIAQGHLGMISRPKEAFLWYIIYLKGRAWIGTWQHFDGWWSVDSKWS